MNYWMAGLKERVSSVNPAKVELPDGNTTTKRVTYKEAKEYPVGDFARGFFQRGAKEKIAALAAEACVRPEYLQEQLGHILDALKFSKGDPWGPGEHPSLDIMVGLNIGSDEDEIRWRGWNQNWLHWETKDPIALILLSLRNGLAAGRLYVCRECVTLCAREPKQGRQELCDKCGSPQAIRERRKNDPLAKAWNNAYQRMYQRTQQDNESAWTPDDFDEWKNVAKSHLEAFVKTGISTVEHWQQTFVEKWVPSSKQS